VSTIFIAQVFGITLGLSDLLIVVLTATLASVGAAGVPGIGMVTLTIVLNQIGIPIEGIALVVGVERILDMTRTAVNVTGDTCCSVWVAKTEGELNIPTNNSEAAAGAT
jgi:Na+/H+-dicarboxylate symporter